MTLKQLTKGPSLDNVRDHLRKVTTYKQIFR
jgi:hypothetical protein